MASPLVDHFQSESSLKSLFIHWNSLLGSQLAQMVAPGSVWTLVTVALWACKERLGSRGTGGRHWRAHEVTWGSQEGLVGWCSGNGRYQPVKTSSRLAEGRLLMSTPVGSLSDHWITISLKKLLNEKSPLYRSFRMKVSCAFPQPVIIHMFTQTKCPKWICPLGPASALGGLVSKNRAQETIASCPRISRTKVSVPQDWL